MLFAAFSMLAGVVPAASVSLFRKPNFFNYASRSAAAHGFLPAKKHLLLSKISNTDFIDADGPALAAGLYVVL